METRFGVKDLILYAMIVLIGVLVLLGQKQYDRQWQLLQQMQATASDQGRDLADLRRQVDRGLRGALVASGPATTRPAGDPFDRIRAAEALPDYAQGDWLVDSGPNTSKLTPLVSFDAFAAKVHTRVLQSLVEQDPVTLDYRGLLALPGWTVEDHVAAYHAFVDPLVVKGQKLDDAAKAAGCPCPIRITFHVRPNLTFSDGVPLTADDVVWTFGWIMNPAVGAARARSGLSKIRRVVRAGPDAVTFEFATPYFDAVGLAGGMNVLPRHFYERYTPDQFNASTGLLLGSGPYRMPDPTAWKPGQQIELVRNDRYWGEPPAFNRLVYKIITADLPRLTAFTNGELDAFAPSPEQYRKLSVDPEITKRAQHFAFETAVAPYRYIAWNEQRGGKPTHFADRRVRQALTMLTDRQRICDDVMLGLATVATGPFNRLGKQADPAVKPWPYDVTRAVAMLREAGFTQDADGVMHEPSGAPFTIRLTYPNGVANYDRMALVLRDSYARAGIAVEPERLDWSVMKPKLDKRDYDAVAIAWTVGVEDDIYQIFDSKEIADQGDDYMGYANPELDQLIERARETLDQAVRLPLWRRCHDILHEDQPYTFLFTQKQTQFLADRIRNVQLLPLGLNSFAEWFVPAGLQKYTQ